METELTNMRKKLRESLLAGQKLNVVSEDLKLKVEVKTFFICKFQSNN